MPYIKVDHSELKKTADAVETYVGKHKSCMSQAGQEVTSLKQGWSGSDYDALTFQWKTLNENDSTSKKMISAAESYVALLRYAADQYIGAQSDAVNRANWLQCW